MATETRDDSDEKRIDFVLLFLRAWVGFWIGVLATIPAIIVAWHATGLGHGSQWLTKLIFPYSYVYAYWFRAFGLPSILLCLCQFPLYGAILTIAPRRVAKRIGVVIIFMHIMVLVILSNRTL